MKVLVTGAAGFIGHHVAMALLERGHEVIGVDSHNDYYDPQLKEDRVARVAGHAGYRHERADIADRQVIEQLFLQHRPQRVVHLAAQAGVRYGTVNPHAYASSNLVGFLHVLEGCRTHGVEHLVFASSSSVYGANPRRPFSEHDGADHPLSLYAATKKANEQMAHAYSHLYRLPATGLRFFTVYGPWGRPDMSPMLFARAILAGEPVNVFNHGGHTRSFTYIDDIVEGVLRVLDTLPRPDPQWADCLPDPASSPTAPYRLYNIGNSRAVELLGFIRLLEMRLGREACIRFLPMQPGDMPHTVADESTLAGAVGYSPLVGIEEGVARFVEWYLGYMGHGRKSLHRPVDRSGPRHAMLDRGVFDLPSTSTAM